MNQPRPWVVGAARLGPGCTGSSVAFEATDAWLATFRQACLDHGDQVRMVPIAGAVLPMRLRTDDGGHRVLASLTNFYSCRFVAPGLRRDEATAAMIGEWARELRRKQDGPHTLRFEALDEDGAERWAVELGLRRAGFLIESFRHFGNWFVNFDRSDFESYWADRPARLRHTVERRYRQLRRAGGFRLRILRDPADTHEAVRLYEGVHARSWQPSEPYPRFMALLIHAGLHAQQVWVPVLEVDSEPVAAQVWIWSGNEATIFKLCYVEAQKRLSAGSILTFLAMRQAMEEQALGQIDFGRGDDPYKQDWMPCRRQRWGVAAYDAGRWRGLTAAARNLTPRVLRRVMSALPNPARSARKGGTR